MKKLNAAGSIMVLLFVAAFAGAGSWWVNSEMKERALPASDAVVTVNLEDRLADLNARIGALEARHNDDASQIDSLINSVAELRHQPDVPKITIAKSDFEVSEGQARELAPGVVMTISHMNVERQQVNGWVYLQNEHRILWLKNHGLLQPVTLYNADGKQQQDIVFTRVRNNDAVGYLIDPGDRS